MISRVLAAVLALSAGACGGVAAPAGSQPTPQIITVLVTPVPQSPSAKPSPSAAPSEAETHRVVGELVLHGAGTSGSRPCAGEGGYSDVQGGMPITVRDAGGTVIGSASLGNGSTNTAGACRFSIDVTVPRSDFYTFALGRRGEISYSYAEMTEQGWHVYFTLGQ